MAASIKKAVGEDPELIEGKSGIFDVAVDGTVIYSKHETGRFPEDDEVLAKLEA